VSSEVIVKLIFIFLILTTIISGRKCQGRRIGFYEQQASCLVYQGHCCSPEADGRDGFAPYSQSKTKCGYCFTGYANRALESAQAAPVETLISTTVGPEFYLSLFSDNCDFTTCALVLLDHYDHIVAAVKNNTVAFILNSSCTIDSVCDCAACMPAPIRFFLNLLLCTTQPITNPDFTTYPLDVNICLIRVLQGSLSASEVLSCAAILKNSGIVQGIGGDCCNGNCEGICFLGICGGVCHS